jgi:flagellar protein FlaH
MARAKVRVLLVEDSLYDAAIVRHMLGKDEHLDFEVDWAQSTRQCLERLKDKTFELVLLDYNLPGEDGLALLRRLNGKANMPPIIMLSGWGDEGVAAEAMRYGAHSYCSKNSIVSGVLALKIHEALDKHPQGKGEKRLGDELQSPSQPPAGETDVVSNARDKRMLSTGDELLDYRMGGGIPVGSLTLIDGESGAGKSVLAQHFVWGALKDESRVVLYTNESTSHSLVSQMASLGMDVADYTIRGKLEVCEIPAGNAGEQASPNLDMLTRHMSQLPDWDLVVVDSLTGFIANPSDQEVFSFFTRCKQYYAEGKTIVSVVHSNAFSDTSLSRIVSVCDVYLRLRIEVMGDRLVKRLEVAKIRGAGKVTGRILTFDVEPGIGIVPAVVVSRARA